MKATQYKIGELKDFKFEIPFYQRAYSWRKQDIEKLISDISAKDGHYLGNIVVKQNGDNKFIIIDGQQRLTTIYIIFMALRVKEKPFELDYEIDGGDGEKLTNFDVNEHRYTNKQILDAVLFVKDNKKITIMPAWDYFG